MTVDVECDECGLAHRIPDRPDGPKTGVTECPRCSGRSFTVRYDGLEWHPET